MDSHRYVILRHEVPAGTQRVSHWDLMLELGPETPLMTWALEELPSDGKPVLARQLNHHRRIYLEYEGELSAGRGRVWRWDEGDYLLLAGTMSDLLHSQDPHSQGDDADGASRDSASEFAFQLNGRRMRGTLRMRREEAKPCQFWKFTFVGSIAVR